MSANAPYSDPAWAWAPYQPDAERPWDVRLAGHLYGRGAFGANWGQLQAALVDGPQATIDKLFHPGTDFAEFNRRYDDYERSAAQSSAAEGPQAWWLRRICESPHPLLERMTLFWHNHFAISDTQVNNPWLMCRYVQRLRGHALGNFGALLEAVADEPAVFVCCGARASRKAKPTVELPRVLLEQFTLGSGHFSEKDVQEVARVLTGWFFSQNELRYSSREHDSGERTLLGETGDFDKKDLVRILSQQPATAQLIVTKLYGWFISEAAPPSATVIAPLAARFSQDLDIARLVETMLRSNLFFSAAAYRQRIKSPVEFALSVIKPLEGSVGTVRLAADLADLGQDLYHPPTIKGWAGNRYWINRFTLCGRIKLAQTLLASSGPYGGKLDPYGSAARNGQKTVEAATRHLFELLLQSDPEEHSRSPLAEEAADSSGASAVEQLRRRAALIAALPEFNLA